MTTAVSSPAESSVRQTAIDRAVKLLEAAKASFAIRLPDGTFIGELPVTAPKRRRVNNWMEEFPGYSEAVKSMEIGDVLVWTLDSQERCEAFRSTVSSISIHHHGKGSAITSISNNQVEILRVQ